MEDPIRAAGFLPHSFTFDHDNHLNHQSGQLQSLYSHSAKNKKHPAKTASTDIVTNRHVAREHTQFIYLEENPDWRSVPFPKVKLYQTDLSSISDTMSGHRQPATARRSTSYGDDASDQASGVSRSGSQKFAFLSVTDPQQFKDPDRMRRVRRHVMRNHVAQQSSRKTPKQQAEDPRTIPSNRVLAPAPSSRPPLSRSPTPRSVHSSRSSHTMGATGSYMPMAGLASSTYSQTMIYDAMSSSGHTLTLADQTLQDPFGLAFHPSERVRSLWNGVVCTDRMVYLSSLCISAAQADAVVPDMSSYSAALEQEVGEMLRGRLSDSALEAGDATLLSMIHVSYVHSYKASDSIMQQGQDYVRHVWNCASSGGNAALIGVAENLISVNALVSSVFSEGAVSPRWLNEVALSCSMERFHAGLLESPLCCIGEDYHGLLYSARFTEAHLDLLRLARQMCDYAIKWPSSGIDFEMLRFMLGQHPPANEIHTSMGEVEYCYEACRLATMIIERAISGLMPLSAAAAQLGVLPHLRRALELSNVESCWGDAAGVLLWVSLIGAAAAHQDRDMQWYRAVAMRIIIKYALDRNPAMTQTLSNLQGLQRFCGSRAEQQQQHQQQRNPFAGVGYA